MTKRLITMFVLLLLPTLALALDAETQALERAALCQAMPYREECGGKPRPAPQPIPPPAAAAPPAHYAPRTMTREDFIRGAGIMCLGEMPRLRQMVSGYENDALYIACVRAYLAREGLTIP